ncbi:hypothetical protein [Streptomyces goshikiensis]
MSARAQHTAVTAVTIRAMWTSKGAADWQVDAKALSASCNSDGAFRCPR